MLKKNITILNVVLLIFQLNLNIFAADNSSFSSDNTSQKIKNEILELKEQKQKIQSNMQVLFNKLKKAKMILEKKLQVKEKTKKTNVLTEKNKKISVIKTVKKQNSSGEQYYRQHYKPNNKLDKNINNNFSKNKQNKTLENNNSVISFSTNKFQYPIVSSQITQPKIPEIEYAEPEIKNKIIISKLDINRFVCEKGNIVGVFYSQDKGIVGKKAGANFFLRVVPGSFSFNHPFELYLMCGDEKEKYVNTYPFFITGDRISSRTIVLKKGISENIEAQKKFFTENTRTDNIIKIIKNSYKEIFPEEFNVQRIFKIYNPLSFNHSPDEMKIILYKTIDTGLWLVDIYFVQALKDLQLDNEDFVKENTVAVSVFNPFLHKGQFGKVVVIKNKINNF